LVLREQSEIRWACCISIMMVGIGTGVTQHAPSLFARADHNSLPWRPGKRKNSKMKRKNSNTKRKNSKRKRKGSKRKRKCSIMKARPYGTLLGWGESIEGPQVGVCTSEGGECGDT